MISATKGGRPPPPVPPRPSKQVVAEALAKNRSNVLTKPTNNVTKLIDRTEKNIGNYVNNAIRKREDIVNAKNMANINNNQQFVAWGGTVVYRSPSFIKEEEKKNIERNDKCKEKEQDCKKDVELKCDVTNDTSLIIPTVDDGKIKTTAMKAPVAKVRSFDKISNEKSENYIVRDNIKIINKIEVSRNVKDVVKNINEESSHNIDKLKKQINIKADIDEMITNNSVNEKVVKNDVKENSHGYEKKSPAVSEFVRMEDIKTSNATEPSNIKKTDASAEHVCDMKMDNTENIILEPVHTDDTKTADTNNPKISPAIELIEKPAEEVKQNISKQENINEFLIKTISNSKEQTNTSTKDIQIKTTNSSVTKVSITAVPVDKVSPADQTRVVIGGTGICNRISTNMVPTTTTTIEIRGEDSTTSSIISNTVSNSVQITLCRPELSRSFGDAALSIRPEPEGGETEKPNPEKPRKLSSASAKKGSISFSDVANHELLIAELQDMRQDKRIRKRQRQPDNVEETPSKPRLESTESCPKSDTSTLDDQDLDSISTSDWTEISNDGAEVPYSSCRITLDDKDSSAEACFARERRDSGNSSSNSESPSLSRMSASLPPGLPPLPKSLSGFELRGGASGGVSAHSRPPPPEPPRTGRPQATLDTQLAVLRREMFGLRQLDLSLLSQLWALNESIQDFRQMLQEQEQDDEAGLMSPPSPRSPTPPSTSASEEAEEEQSQQLPQINARTMPHHVVSGSQIMPPRSAAPTSAPPPAPARPRPKPAARSRPAPPPPPPARRGPGKTSAV